MAAKRRDLAVGPVRLLAAQRLLQPGFYSGSCFYFFPLNKRRFVVTRHQGTLLQPEQALPSWRGPGGWHCGLHSRFYAVPESRDDQSTSATWHVGKGRHCASSTVGLGLPTVSCAAGGGGGGRAVPSLCTVSCSSLGQRGEGRPWAWLPTS